jgi:hypothetical protein
MMFERSDAAGATIGRGIIMEATSLSLAQSAIPTEAVELQSEVGTEETHTPGLPTAEFQRLMDLADRYARQLVATADAPPGVLMLVTGSDLDVVTLDGPDADVRSLPRLLAQRRPTSAVLVATDGSLLADLSDRLVVVVGETIDGQRDERRFRMRACGRTRRLTRIPDHDLSVAPSVVPRLFPSWLSPMA